MVAVLRRDGWSVNRKRVRRLMRVMGLEAIYQKPNTSQGHPDHKVYPYLLRGLAIERPNQVWCADITYIPMAQGVCVSGGGDGLVQPAGAVVAGVDHHGGGLLRRGVAGSDGRSTGGRRFSTPIRGCSSPARSSWMNWRAAGVRISMDGKGRFLDNIFIERLWRSLKYEEVFIKAYGSVAEARRGIGGWLAFYNDERPHQALGYRTPREVIEAAACEYVDNASASLRAAPALPTYSQAQHQEKEVINVLTKYRIGSILTPQTPLGSGGAMEHGGTLS